MIYKTKNIFHGENVSLEGQNRLNKLEIEGETHTLLHKNIVASL